MACSTKVLKTTFRLKRGKSATWTKLNPILASGEPGFELDTNRLKVGDGVTPWNSLSYLCESSEDFDGEGIPFEKIQTLFKEENNHG